MIEYPFAANTPEWMEARRGVITASRAKDARRSDGLTSQQRTYVNAIKAGRSEAAAREAAGYKATPKAEAVEKAIAGTLVPVFGESAHTYAKELARERLGGHEPEGFQGLSQRIGHEEEQFAAIEYIARTGHVLESAFFVTTEDRKFGMTPDRWVSGRAGFLEIKTMVSSTTLFKAMVDGDIDEYRDQCLFGLWHFTLPWADLGLWCPDLSALGVKRITRDEEELQAFEDDMVAFDGLVEDYVRKLAKAIGRDTQSESGPPWDATSAPAQPGPLVGAAPVKEAAMERAVARTADLIANPFAI